MPSNGAHAALWNKHWNETLEQIVRCVENAKTHLRPDLGRDADARPKGSFGSLSRFPSS